MALKPSPIAGTTFGATLGTLGGTTGFPLTDTNNSFGGWKYAATTVARNALPLSVLQNGTPCWVEADNTVYVLNATWAGVAAPVDADWTAIGSGGGITGIGSTNSIPIWTSATNISANINFTRGPVTQIVNNEQGFELGVNTITQRFVDPAGSDSNNGLSALTPWATRQHAMDEMEALLPGPYEIVSAPGIYSEQFSSPYKGMGRGVNSGGTLVQNIGDETTPANVILAASDTIYSNELFDRGYDGSIRFAGIRFVGTNSPGLVSSAGALVFIRNCEFSQINDCLKISLNTLLIVEPGAVGIIADTINTLFSIENNALTFLSSNVTVTNLTGNFAEINYGSQLFMDNNLTINVTGTNASTFFNLRSGTVETGHLNQLNYNGTGNAIELQLNSNFRGGQDNVFQFTDASGVAQLGGTSSFTSSNDGSTTYTIGGSTPSTNNFLLNGQSYLYNRVNSGSGSDEIPMEWVTSENLATSRYVLATDFRYTSPTIGIPGIIPPGNGFFLTTVGLADTALPVFVAKFKCKFPQFTIKSRIANGPNGMTSVTDTYTVYRNGSPTAMSGIITDGNTLTVVGSTIICEPEDEISIFITTDANTLVQDISLSI